MLKAGADPNARDEGGHTPLYMVGSYGSDYSEVIATLVKAGADPNARDEDGQTALHQVAQATAHPETVTALIKAGADPNARDEDGNTPLHRAAFHNANPEILTALLEGVLIPTRGTKMARLPCTGRPGTTRIPRSSLFCSRQALT